MYQYPYPNCAPPREHRKMLEDLKQKVLTIEKDLQRARPPALTLAPPPLVRAPPPAPPAPATTPVAVPAVDRPTMPAASAWPVEVALVSPVVAQTTGPAAVPAVVDLQRLRQAAAQLRAAPVDAATPSDPADRQSVEAAEALLADLQMTLRERVGAPITYTYEDPELRRNDAGLDALLTDLTAVLQAFLQPGQTTAAQGKRIKAFLENEFYPYLRQYQVGDQREIAGRQSHIGRAAKFLQDKILKTPPKTDADRIVYQKAQEALAAYDEVRAKKTAYRANLFQQKYEEVLRSAGMDDQALSSAPALVTPSAPPATPQTPAPSAPPATPQTPAPSAPPATPPPPALVTPSAPPATPSAPAPSAPPATPQTPQTESAPMELERLIQSSMQLRTFPTLQPSVPADSEIIEAVLEELETFKSHRRKRAEAPIMFTYGDEGLRANDARLTVLLDNVIAAMEAFLQPGQATAAQGERIFTFFKFDLFPFMEKYEVGNQTLIGRNPTDENRYEEEILEAMKNAQSKDDGPGFRRAPEGITPVPIAEEEEKDPGTPVGPLPDMKERATG